MTFRPEPPYTHGNGATSAVLLVNLGTPSAPNAAAVRRYLKQFLSDPRVIEIPRAIWWFLLRLFVLPLRAGRSAHRYALVWTKEGSPLWVYTERQAKLLLGALGERGHRIRVEFAMRYGEPSVADALDRLKRAGVDRILVVPLYPQYAAATTASVFDAVSAWSEGTRNLPEFRFVKHYHDHPAYIGALAQSVKNFWERHGFFGGNGRARTEGQGPRRRLIMSFHGLPRASLSKGDPYHCECQKTGRLLGQALGLNENEIEISFQSRFGRAQWLKPYTFDRLAVLAGSGIDDVDVCCPGFVSDCLETLEEIALEGRAVFLGKGGKSFRYIPCLNDSPEWIAALASIVEEHLQGWPTMNPPRVDPAGRARALGLGALD